MHPVVMKLAPHHLLWLLVCAAPAPAMAQAIHGVVVDDDSLQPVGYAAVRLVAGDVVVLGREADAEGRFLLPVPSEGDYRLEMERLGYETVRSQAIRVEEGDTIQVEFRVRANAVLLDPITVIGLSNRGRHRFERRRTDWGRGVFLTPEMIDSIAPRHPADVFRAVDKVYVRWGWGDLASGGRGRLPDVRSQLGRGCMMYMVNRIGVRPAPWVSIVQPWAGYQLAGLGGEEVVAVEVYRSYNEVPPELLRYTHISRSTRSDTDNSFGPPVVDLVNCGLVVFWTGEGW